MELMYEPLGPRQIRLLRFPLTFPAPIDLELITVNLDDRPKYWPVSYTWAGEENPTPVRINGVEVKLKENLLAALTHVDRITGLYAWADAICINQADQAERSAQVRLMREIYESAEIVVVYLGLPDYLTPDHVVEEQIRLGCSKMREIARIMDAIGDDVDVCVGKLIEKHGEVCDRPTWHGIKAFFDSEYWTRTWTAQECTVADDDTQSTVVLYFIHNCIEPMTWFTIDGTLLFFNKLAARRIDRKDNPTGPGPTIGIAHIKRWREMQDLCSLGQVLELFCRFSASDPRDKVYAPIGMMRDISTAGITIDYNKTVSEVYLDVAMVLIKESKRPFDFLNWAQNSEHRTLGPDMPKLTSALPTWVPDWSKDFWYESLPTSSASDHMDTLDNSPLYHADGDIGGSFECEASSLFLHGFLFDSISAIEPLDHGAEYSEVLRRALTWQPNEALSTDPAEISKRVDFGPICRTLRVDTTRRPSETRRGYSPAWAAEPIPIEKIEDVVQQAYNGHAIWYLNGRNLGYTKNGHFALLPPSCRVGDHVAVFYGGQMCYIIRERREEFITTSDSDGDMCGLHSSRYKEFEFVEACYVDGMMDGQALDPKIKQPDICIKLI